MIAAAIALAIALLVVPASPRHRLSVAASRRRPRVPGLAVAAVIVAGSALLLPVSVATAAGLVTATIAWRRRRVALARRRDAESADVQGALGVLIGELRVGAHPVTAFEAAARESGGSTAGALRDVAARARLGADVSVGLAAVARNSTAPSHWERLADCWRLAHVHGLSIATLLRTAHRDAVERDRFATTVRAGTAGARATATILAALPVLGVGLGQLIGADPLRFLLSDGLGGWLLVVGATLICAGLLWSDRIIDRVIA
ncbi:type II secretion system F family protein [Mycolicibacterium sediminis]|uniref:Type II secretion system protein GspF domain-containing protein n=1 Tax=Mycolicibacterium sediminis TaxID=1286180 RepID=A0A7I7QIZ5_9MYCO|nr:hypothetical protein [Mycolicibacterium sediminis]BBY26261.1 hypothetical protein MSEDJ_03570 [Mycolicibacterium sediminis]